MQVCVYCASSAKIDSAYFEATEALAKSLVANDFQVVFGGGSSGLMGKLADTVLENGGRIRGIMPQFMNEVEWGHKGVSDFIYTHTMHERKAKFLEGTDAIIALPGGPGTFEELFEAITLRKLGQISTPIVVLNTNGYFNLFADLMQQAVSEKFMTDDEETVWKMVNEPEEVIPCIRNFKTKKIELKQAGTLR
jgi:uncharacterized protein (TIGR00730 family)